MAHNIEVVQKFFQYYTKRDLEGMKTVLANNIHWHIPGHHPLSGIKKGREEVIAFFRKLQKANFKADLIILGENDNYVIDCHRG